MAWWCWLLGFFILWLSTFGFWFTIIPPLLILALVFGLIFGFYSKTKEPLTIFQKNLLSDIKVKAGIRKFLEINSSNTSKIDQRLTGSQIIDESIQEILQYLIRDFVCPWYGKLTDQDDFGINVRESLQKVVINIASRMKDVEWIPYLTTRLVDDAATHLRLYRLTCEKIKAIAVKKAAPQSLASFKSATEGCHSRNNSDGTMKIKTHSRNSSLSEKPESIESMFFRIEAESENFPHCHEQLCTNREYEKSYLNYVVDTVLFLVLPENDFQSLPARNLIREIVIGGLLLPLIELLAEPDCINKCIVRLCSDFGITSDAFLATLRVTSDPYEFTAMQDFVAKEMTFLRSRDAGSEADAIKQQINSLMYIKKTIDFKLQQGADQKVKPIVPEKLVQVPLPVILTNSLALSYFIDYLSTLDLQNIIFLHLAIESWRSSLIECKLSEVKMPGNQVAEFREAARNICEHYFGDSAPAKVRLDQVAESVLVTKIINEPLNENCFGDIQQIILKKLADKALPDFYKSHIYLKLLSDLELIKDEVESPDNLSLTGSLEDEDISNCTKNRKADVGVGKFQLKVDIIENGVVQDRGKTYGIYALSVLKTYENGFSQQWHVYRRYSDFYDLQQKIKDSYSDLGKLPFPGKKTFNNMGALTLAKRMKMLNDYLQILLHSGVADTHRKLPGLLLSFLEAGEYDKSFTFGSAFESLVSPIKSSMRSVSAAVKTVPDNLWGNDGITRKKETKDENVPVRILLLLLDEVCDLQHRNQWLRRRIVTLLRQIFGDMLTRKMFDYVEDLTSPVKVAGYISNIKEILWPNGVRANVSPLRDQSCKLRTKILAKASLLSAADDFKHLLGSETIRRGLLRVFSTFQYSGINRRLFYVIFEGVSELIFPPLVDINNSFKNHNAR